MSSLRLRLYFANIILVFAWNVHGQDLAMVHFDKSFYVSGEVAWFSVFPPAAWGNQEVAVRVTVSTGDNSSHFFIKKQAGSPANGYFQIPYNASPGIFEFRFQVALKDQFEEQDLAYAYIPVYSDLQDPGEIEISEIASAEADQPNDVDISVLLSKASISPRDQITMQIKAADKGGNTIPGSFSVSVKDHELAGTTVLGSRSTYIGKPLPEFNPADLESQVTVRGQVYDLEDNPLLVNVLGGYSGEENHIFYTRSDENGHFILKMEDYYGSKPIQFMGFQYEHPELIVEVPSDGFQGEETPLIYTEGILRYLELSQIRKKIYQQYQSFETELQPELRPWSKATWEPDVSFDIAEYESFEDMKGFFGELITPLRFVLEKDSTYSAELINVQGTRARNAKLNGPPLFIVDNMVTRDADFIADMSTDYIVRVELFLDRPKLRDYFQAVGASGVVRITTSLDRVEVPAEDERNLVEAPGIQPRAEFPAYESSSFPGGSHRPYFRPQVYWNPQVEVDNSGTTEVTFGHPDDTGQFVIEVLFQSEDGLRGWTTSTYEVSLN